MSVSYGGDSITFADNSTISSGWTGFKNRIINGDMRIDQRFSGSANTVVNDTANYVMDRWRFYENTDGVLSVQRISSDAPEGYRYSSKVTVSTADTSLSASQIAIVSHRIEGYNMDDFNWGKSTARTATLSFWVKSSLTGKFSGSFYNMNSGSVQRTYVFDYTINSANTWEKKTVTIVGDTNTNWNSGTDATVEIIWGFGTGSNYKTGTVNQWFTGFASQSTGSVDLVGTLNATWQITGVQFELGSTASSFEYRPYGTELALCQRYYIQSSSYILVQQAYDNRNNTQLFGTIQHKQSMRIAPSVVSSVTGFSSGSYGGVDSTSVDASTIYSSGSATTQGVYITGYGLTSEL